MADAISAQGAETQIPVTPQIKGNVQTSMSSKTKARTNEMMAEINPLFSAVKNPDPKMEKPQTKKTKL